MKRIITLLVLGVAMNLTIHGQGTYKIGNTEYYIGKTYSTTGKPMVKRSEANKKAFLRSIGFSRVPYGFQVDHIIPLSNGGSDDPSNMQLLTIQQHRRKTAIERSSSTISTYSLRPRNYNFSSTRGNLSGSSFKSNLSYPTLNGSSRPIYTGSRGGRYRINNRGKRVYLKSKKRAQRNYYSSSSTYRSSVNSFRSIQTGPRGGRFYINSKGNKTYVRKRN